MKTPSFVPASVPFFVHLFCAPRHPRLFGILAAGRWMRSLRGPPPRSALSSVLAAPAMKDRRGRGWGLFFGYPSNILYYFVFIFCTRFIVIIPSILLSCNYLLLLHKSQHIPVHCNQFGWLTCREMFADENPSSSCRNYRGKSGEGRNSPTVFSRAIARRATSRARRQSG